MCCDDSREQCRRAECIDRVPLSAVRRVGNDDVILVCHWLCQCFEVLCGFSWMKQPTSKQIRELLVENNSPLVQQLTVQERPGKFCFRFWQEGPGFDRNLFSPAAIASSIDYIHMNPVKRGLCQSAVDFKWSSARFHLRDIVDPDLPVLRKPDPEWFHTTGVRFDSV